jgi:hypothetical protein
MPKIDAYRAILRDLDDWDAYLLAETGLPGPRGNLELAQAVADIGDPARFQRYAAITAEQAPTNTPGEFLAFCGVVGLGRLVAEGQHELVPTLRRHASDPRWRLREAVAMALQRLGYDDMDRLLAEMRSWAQGSPLEQRAAAAALCEPRLLAQPAHARATLEILEAITATIPPAQDRKSEGFRALRQGLGYCWSVAVVALPEAGKPLMEAWLSHPDLDIRWIMRENLKKARLARMDAAWVDRCRTRLGS